MEPVKAIEVDLDRNEFTTANGTHHLRPRQAELLSILLKNRGHVVRYDAIIQKLYGIDEPPGAAATLSVHCFELRKKLKLCGFTVVSYSKVGYELVEIKETPLPI